MTLKQIPAVIMRGGTSKGIFFHKKDLPEDRKEIEKIVTKIFGSGDKSQIDGLGGATPHTSKLMIVWKSDREGIDVEYLFGQVGIEERYVDWNGNCGNLASAVAAFSIDEKLVEPKEPETYLRMYNVNTNKQIDAVVPVENGMTKYEGDFYIPGVPNPGSKIKLIWRNPGGSVTGRLLPTGNVIDEIYVEGKRIPITVIDAGNPVVFLEAKNVGMQGTELPTQVNKSSIDLLEKIRLHVAVILGFAEDISEAKRKSPHLPLIAIVSTKKDYKTVDGKIIKKNQYDILARLFHFKRMHHAYAVTGSIATGIASVLKDSVVNRVSKIENKQILIGHPKGVMDVIVEKKGKDNYDVTIWRTARKLMKGVAYYIP